MVSFSRKLFHHRKENSPILGGTKRFIPCDSCGEQFLKFCLRHQLFKFKQFYMETRFSNIFKTTNVTNFTRAILKSSYRVLQVIFKWKTLKQPVYFFKTTFSSTFSLLFDNQIDITLAIY